MIGGIFCSCTVGKVYVPEVVDSINRYSYMLFGEKALSQDELNDIIVLALLRSATYAMKYVSAKGGRDYKNDTIDLMKSMGVVVYSKQGEIVAYQKYSASKASSEQSYSKKIEEGLLGGLGVSEFTTSRVRKHPNPDERFTEFIKGIPQAHSYRGNGWSVAFVATMPYAVRLEHKRVDDSGGYEKRVLIGNINSVVNAFYRQWGTESNRGVKYGYIFETTNAVESISI
jgi:hypothetical protein